MKRSVAIHGPTPSFVRWAIRQPCCLRPTDSNRFVDQTFRCLRSLRCLSVALEEGRCANGFCVHPSAHQLPVESVEGFSVDEVTSPYGGLGWIEGACGGCPANVATPSNTSNEGYEGYEGYEAEAEAQRNAKTVNRMVGCYGFLARDGSSLDQILAGHVTEEGSGDIATQMFHTLRQNESLQNAWPTLYSCEVPKSADVMWHTLWRSLESNASEPSKSARATRELEISLDRLRFWKEFGFAWSRAVAARSVAASSRGQPSQPLRDFFQAVNACCDHAMPLVVELVPSGYSDGKRWQLDPSCSNCGWVPEAYRGQACSDQRVLRTWDPGCRGCGRTVIWTSGPKFKVLGTRPYMRLVDIVGTEGVEILMNELA